MVLTKQDKRFILNKKVTGHKNKHKYETQSDVFDHRVLLLFGVGDAIEDHRKKENVNEK